MGYEDVCACILYTIKMNSFPIFGVNSTNNGGPLISTCIDSCMAEYKLFMDSAMPVGLAVHVAI